MDIIQFQDVAIHSVEKGGHRSRAGLPAAPDCGAALAAVQVQICVSDVQGLVRTGAAHSGAYRVQNRALGGLPCLVGDILRGQAGNKTG